MESLTSREAAARLGVNIQRFHRLVAEHGIEPMIEGAGIRGPKFWDPTDIARLAAELRAVS